MIRLFVSFVIAFGIYVLLLAMVLYFTQGVTLKKEPKKEVIAIDMSLIEPQPTQQPQPFEAYDEEVNEEQGKAEKEVIDEKPPQKIQAPQPKLSPPSKQAQTPSQPKQTQPQTIKQEQLQPVFPSLQEISAALHTHQTKEGEKRALSHQERELKELYGSEFESLGSEQKKFLTTNIKTIQTITQRHLNAMGYPQIAIRTRQNGVNLVEFYLYDNGDISDLKLIEHSNFRALDAHTIELIQRAYKDYPYPNEKTLVRIKVVYNAF